MKPVEPVSNDLIERAWCALEQGRPYDALQQLEDVIDVAPSEPVLAELTRVRAAARAGLALRLGRVDAAGERLEEAAGPDLAEQGTAGRCMARLRAELKLAQGAPNEARALLLALVDERPVNDPVPRVWIDCLLMRAALQRNDRLAASEALTHARRLVDEHRLERVRSLTTLASGQRAAALGLTEDALDRFRDVIREASTRDDPLLVVEAGRWHSALAPLEPTLRARLAEATEAVAARLAPDASAAELANPPELSDLLGAPARRDDAGDLTEPTEGPTPASATSSLIAPPPGSTEQRALAVAERILAVEDERRALRDEVSLLREQLAAAQRKVEELESRCAHLEADLRTRLSSRPLGERFEDIVAASPTMRRLLTRLQPAIDSAIPVAISGARGTGKETLARAIHYMGARRTGPFVAVHCDAVPPTAIESEIFGNARGDLPAADRGRVGMLVAARGGTLYLDAVHTLPAPAQVKLLLALDEGPVRPVGGPNACEVDVRVVAASHERFSEWVERGALRADLYQRLAGLEIEVPSLSQRRDDVPGLVARFLASLPGETPALEHGVLELLMNQEWPGNVRQLRNIIETAHALSDRRTLRVADVAPLLSSPIALASPTRPGRRGPPPRARRDEVVRALNANGGDVERTAAALGVSARSVYRYLKRYGLSPAS